MHTRTHKIFPKEFPEPWAGGWGEDEYGLWMSFAYKGVEQVFRWCEPGEFLMGSPEDEPEREDNEEQYEDQVELSKGFWIADSTVTQSLWLAVMGDNPSNFKGDRLPVADVNWEEAQVFINKLNELKPSLKLCLPSEEQWEYACRSGTATPFYFGENITPELVNYKGDRPYNDGSKGECREQTVAVKSLPPNGWGLYEMHGNVWEWCQKKWLTHSEATYDPFLPRPETSADLVLRGGSQAYGARYCRSAFRLHYEPTDRLSSIGFRLARGC